MIFRMAVAFGLLVLSSQSFAIDCSNLDRRSDAYQTCMLRQENQSRDIRSQGEKEDREAREKEQAKKGAMTDFQIADNFGVLADMIDLVGPSLSQRGKKDCEGAFDNKYGLYGIMFCKEKSIIVLLALNQSLLVQEFAADIENKKLEAIYVGGFSVLTKDSKNYLLQPHKKGVAIYIGLNGSPDTIKELTEQIRRKSKTEVFFKSERQSTKFSLDPVPIGQL